MLFFTKERTGASRLWKKQSLAGGLSTTKKEQLEQEERDKEAAKEVALERVEIESKSNFDSCLADASNSYTLDWLQEFKSQNLLSNDCKKFADSSYTSQKYTSEHNLSLIDDIMKFYEEQDKCSCRLPQYNGDVNDKRYKERKDECFKQYSQ